MSFLRKGLKVTRSAHEVGPAVGLVAVPHAAGGREGQRTEVTNGHGHEVVLDLANDGESLVPTAGPGSILVHNPILTSDACVWDLSAACKR